MALLHYLWSRIAANNATADANVNWQEGQAPSSVNDSARAMMASAAAFRDDISGAIVTGGTSTAYTVSSYQVFDTLPHMGGQMLAFTPHATNGATVTLNVDGLGAKPLRSAPGVELLAGVLIQGSPYVALYNNVDSAWYLQNFFVNPYQVPLGGMLDYIGPTAPNSAFVLPIGQAINRTTYAALFSLVGTTYGVGDGSTTFNVPDLTGRTTAMKEAAATRLTSAVGGVDGGTLGAVGGSQSNTLVQANLPNVTLSVVTKVIGRLITTLAGGGGSTAIDQLIGTGGGGTTERDYTGTSAALGSGTAHANVQPTIIVNKILRVI